MAGTRQTSTTTDQRTRRSVPLTPAQWAALKEIARLEQRSMQSQMSVMLGTPSLATAPRTAGRPPADTTTKRPISWRIRGRFVMT